MTVSSNGRSASIDVDSSDKSISEIRPLATVPVASRDETPGGTERIVLAEDDPMIRRTLQHLLKELGYQVEAYTSGPEVLATMSPDRPPVALLLTDHDMPGLSGYELAQQFRSEHPGVHVLLASGRCRESIFPDGQPKDWPPFLRKPFSLRTLACALRNILDGATPKFDDRGYPRSNTPTVCELQGV